MNKLAAPFTFVDGRHFWPELSVQSIAQRAPTKHSSECPALSAKAAAFASASISASTRRAYQGDLEDFLIWGGGIPSSPFKLAEYVAERAAVHSPITISRRLVGISRAHTCQGLADPAKSDIVKAVVRGLRKTNGTPQRQAAPVLREDLLPMLAQMRGVKGIRDRALILVGFAAALRRSELVALDVNAIQFVPEGLLVQLFRSKTDQNGEGRKIAIPYGRTSACPVKALKNWLDVSGTTSGPVFRSVNKTGAIACSRLTDQSVSQIVKQYAAIIGLPAQAYSGHSLRAGLVTSAAKAGVSFAKIQQQTGHRSSAMLIRYIRDASIFENNAAGLLL